MSVNKSLILALETAVEGGSVSIRDYRLGVEIASLIGEHGVSKAENVLENVEILLEKHSIDKNDFESVVLATGAGSATGLKIGAATAKGLAKSFGCRYEEIALWEILAAAADEENSSSKIKKFYLPAGKGRVVARRRRERQLSGDAEIISLEEFYIDLKNSADFDCYVHEDLAKASENNIEVILIRRNLANYLSKIASDNVREINLPLD